MRNNLGVANIEEIMKDNRKKIWAFAMTMYQKMQIGRLKKRVWKMKMT